MGQLDAVVGLKVTFTIMPQIIMFTKAFTNDVLRLTKYPNADMFSNARVNNALSILICIKVVSHLLHLLLHFLVDIDSHFDSDLLHDFLLYFPAFFLLLLPVKVKVDPLHDDDDGDDDDDEDV